jgi:hypothetical protein
VAAQRVETGGRAFALDKAEPHQPTRGIVSEHQQRARIRAVLKPTVLAAVNLRQFAERLTTRARLVEIPALFARQPRAGFHHPCA